QRAMKSVFCLVFALFLCHRISSLSEFLEEPCGATTANRINNGQDAKIESALWTAAIFNLTHFQCGGTLIHRRFILTAAHCMDYGYELYVHLGAYNKSSYTFRHTVSQQIRHPNYNSYTKVNDIGLLKLSDSVYYNDRVQPICISLDPNIKLQVGTFNAFGWGLNNGTESDILQTIRLIQKFHYECSNVLKVQLNSKQICAENPHGDTCRGDSGGPLTSQYKQREIQLGIISYGSPLCNGLGVYTDVTSYGDWIRTTISSYGFESIQPVIPLNPVLSVIQPVDQRRLQVQAVVHSLPRPEGDPMGRTRPIFQRPFSVRPMPDPQFPVYIGCSENGKSSIIRPTIYGPGFEALGVLITDRFVVTVATDLPENSASLEVSIIMGKNYGVYSVDSVLKHPENTDDYKNDIALLKLTAAVRSQCNYIFCSDGINCFNKHQQRTNSYSFIFDHVTKNEFRVQPLSTCSDYTGFEMNENQLCVEDPLGISQPYDKRGDILATKLTLHSGIRYQLMGILSYSSDGIHVFTNVVKFTEWIAYTIINQRM
ncbi:hypothetical protein KR084_011169, partial [Drosophila pseudotakahashii]